MTLNANKKEAMLVTITLDDTAPIEPTNLMKLLGIIIDDKLNFTEHVKLIVVKAGRLVGVIMQLKISFQRKSNFSLISQQFYHI